MALARISGPMLNSTLERQGTNLSIVSNVLQSPTPTVYFDVNNNQLGINNASPQYTLDVNGNAQLGNIVVYNNSISSTTGKVAFGSISNITLTGGSPDQIIYTDGAGNLAFGSLALLAGLEGFTANNIVVGTTPISHDGYGTSALTTGMDVATAINTLDNILGNITNIAGNVVTTGNLFLSVPGYTTVDGVLITDGTGSTSFVDANTVPAVVSINANVSAINANLGAYQLYANANAASQATLINTINANVSSFESYANLYIGPAAYGNANVQVYLPTYTGNLNPGNVNSKFYGNVHADYIFGNTGNVIAFAGGGAIQVPVGSSATRPAGYNGMIRFNTDTPSLEYYEGSTWVPITNTVIDQQITPDGVSQTYTLSQSTTASGVIVSINGTLQNPTVAYTVAGNQITFTEVPLTSDIVDVRFLGAAVTINNTLTDNLTVTGNLTLGGVLLAPLATKTSTSTGTAGQIAWDANYIYVCTATNTWKRVALTGGVF